MRGVNKSGIFYIIFYIKSGIFYILHYIFNIRFSIKGFVKLNNINVYKLPSFLKEGCQASA